MNPDPTSPCKDAIFAALADGNRRKIIDDLRAGPQPVGTLAASLPISRPAVSQHLKVLSDAGLLECQQIGTRRLYRLSNAGVRALKDYIDTLWDDALSAFSAYATQHAAKMSKEAAMSLDPVVKTLSVPVTPQEAFTLFTVKMADWWPLDSHSLTANEDTAPGKVPDALHIDPRKGGLIEETKPDGTRHPWGTITAWEPGDRFAMTWHVGRPEAEATFLDVRFEAQGTGTRITLIHDGWAVLGDQGPAMRGGYFTGWDLVFGQCFAQACGAMTPAE